MYLQSTSRIILVITFLLVCICSGSALAKKDSGKEASDRYLEYIATAQKADSVDDITPYWSGWMVESVENGSEEQKNSRLSRMKESAAKKKDITVTGTEKDGEFWVINLKSVYPDGMKMKGKVKMIQENGNYVIEEEYWTGDLN